MLSPGFAGSKNGLLGLARPCCFPVSRPGFWEAFSVLSPGFATARCKLKPSAAKPAFFLVLDATFDTEATARCKLKPSAAKPSFFIGSGRDV